MYIRITSRCNMKCAHCCYACTSKGVDMSIDTYKKAIKLAEELGDTISIGGGEPTIHPQFWEFLGLALGANIEEGFLWMATNGSQTDTSLALANLAKRGVMGVALSRDIYHESIDPKVIKAFDKPESRYAGFNNQTPDAREIRNVTGKEIKGGRCKDGKVGCCCEDIIIEPDGTIKGCGCKDALIYGTVDNPQIPEDRESGTCSKGR